MVAPPHAHLATRLYPNRAQAGSGRKSTLNVNSDASRQQSRDLDWLYEL